MYAILRILEHICRQQKIEVLLSRETKLLLQRDKHNWNDSMVSSILVQGAYGQSTPQSQPGGPRFLPYCGSAVAGWEVLVFNDKAACQPHEKDKQSQGETN